MVSTCYLPNNVCKISCCIKRLLVLTLAVITVSECSIMLRGEVGGEVAFCCPVDRNKKTELLYLQKRHIFVNGYYRSEKISTYWPNTKVDRDNNVIYMSELNISHAGEYTCHILYNDEMGLEEKIQLTVTANYSKPSVHIRCTDKHDHCNVTCSSHGGYPKSGILWNVTEKTSIANNEEMDQTTQLFNVSSVAFFNCSIMKQQNISCSVDGVSSVFTICEQGNSPETHQPGPVIAVCICVCVGLLMLIMIMMLWCRYKKKISCRPICCGGTNDVL